MNRINKNTRQAVKRGTQYPAVVVDVHGNRASARLSTNGAIIHNLLVVGGPVEVGDSVSVDYTTPEPTIVSVAKEWMTMDDLLRALKKIPAPDPPEPFYELDKIAVFAVDEPAKFAYYPASASGLSSALGYISDDFDEEGILRHWTVRFPPAGPMMPDSWTLWGDAGYSPMKLDFQGYYFKNCQFRSFGYYGTGPGPDPGDPDYEFQQYSCMRVGDDPNGRTGDDFIIFEGCEFYAANGDHPFLVAINEVNYTGDGPSADGYKTKIYLINCTVDCGPDPITAHQPAWFQVYTYNTRWIGVSDITSLPNLTILDDGDRSPLGHTHGTSGSGGGGEVQMYFKELLDVPNSYSGQAGKVARVKLAEDGLEFATSGSGGGVDYFTDLLDTPSIYTDDGGKFVTVKSTEDGLEFTDPPGRVFSFFVPGELSVGDIPVEIPAPEAGVISTVSVNVLTGYAPSGASIIVDVKKNGSSIYPTSSKPTITSGNLSDYDSPPDTTSYAQNDLFSIRIDQVGSSSPGSYLAVQIRCL